MNPFVDHIAKRRLMKDCVHQDKHRLAVWSVWPDDGYLFANTIGKPLHPTT